MAYVPRFENDLFISFAREDNEEDSKGIRWVYKFHRDLQTELNRRLPHKEVAKIWIDEEQFKAGHVSASMLEAARNSALFLAVVSPKSIADGKFSRDELAAFCESGDYEGRVISVELTDIASEDRPDPLRGPKRMQFYWRSPENVAIREAPGQDNYDNKIQILADQIKDLLVRLRNEHAPPPERSNHDLPFAGKTVVIARVTDDRSEEADEILTFLMQLVGRVLPESEDYPHDDAKFAAAFRNYLKQADLVVQLLGNHRSAKLNDLEAEGRPSFARFQYDAARAARVPILQWGGEKIIGDRERNWDWDLLEAPEVLGMGFEEFKRTIRRKLEELAKPPPPVKGFRLYVTVDDDDRVYGSQLEEAAQKLKCDLRLMDREHRIADFNVYSKLADGVLFLYGNAPSSFVERWLEKYAKIRKRRQNKPDAVYYLPRQAGKHPKLWYLDALKPPLSELGSKDIFTTEPIEKIVMELRDGEVG